MDITWANIKKPKILLLVEATSALVLNQNMWLWKHWTKSAIMINRFLSTIQAAGLITIVKNGVLAKKGRHEVFIVVASHATMHKLISPLPLQPGDEHRPSGKGEQGRFPL
ncbi:ABC transporter B family member 7 [Nymphaea thermarum]|nr:ABC transporter B family member 7 [Nymphaea thermarum]